MSKIKMSFWNYVHTGNKHIDVEKAVADWEDLGMNLPMSFHFSERRGHNKQLFIKQLDECYKRGMQVIVDDERTDFRTLEKLGEEEFRKGVQRAVADFAFHPAVYGFHVGDEPDGNQWEIAKTAYKIVLENAPNLKHFINMLPYWNDGDDSFQNCLKVEDENGYCEKLTKFCKETNTKILSYDYYGQCSYFEPEKYKDIYFSNLRIFSEAAKNTGADFYTTLLSVGHWSLRVPTEDDIRWQLFTAIACGAVGISWFFLYERNLDGSFRNAPIDLFWKKTQTYEYLSRQCNIAKEYYFKHFDRFEFLYAKHYYKTYGGFEEFTGDEDLKCIEFKVNPSPLIISKFKDKDGKIMFAVTNNNAKEPVSLTIHFGEKLGNRSRYGWYAPGQMKVFYWD